MTYEELIADFAARENPEPGEEVWGQTPEGEIVPGTYHVFD